MLLAFIPVQRQSEAGIAAAGSYHKTFVLVAALFSDRAPIHSGLRPDTNSLSRMMAGTVDHAPLKSEAFRVW